MQFNQPGRIDLNFHSSQSQHERGNGKLNNKSPVYCQQSSCNALKYINPNTEILSITNDNILKIKFGTDQVLIFYEDWMKNKNSNNILFKELSRNKNYLLIEPKLDKIINKQQ